MGTPPSIVAPPSPTTTTRARAALFPDIHSSSPQSWSAQDATLLLSRLNKANSTKVAFRPGRPARALSQEEVDSMAQDDSSVGSWVTDVATSTLGDSIASLQGNEMARGTSASRGPKQSGDTSATELNLQRNQRTGSVVERSASPLRNSTACEEGGLASASGDRTTEVVSSAQMQPRTRANSSLSAKSTSSRARIRIEGFEVTSSSPTPSSMSSSPSISPSVSPVSPIPQPTPPQTRPVKVANSLRPSRFPTPPSPTSSLSTMLLRPLAATQSQPALAPLPPPPNVRETPDVVFDGRLNRAAVAPPPTLLFESLGTRVHSRGSVKPSSVSATSRPPRASSSHHRFNTVPPTTSSSSSSNRRFSPPKVSPMSHPRTITRSSSTPAAGSALATSASLSSSQPDPALSLSFARRPTMSRKGSMGESFGKLYEGDIRAKRDKVRGTAPMLVTGRLRESRNEDVSNWEAGDTDVESESDSDGGMSRAMHGLETSVFASHRSNSAASLSSASSMLYTSPSSISGSIRTPPSPIISHSLPAGRSRAPSSTRSSKRTPRSIEEESSIREVRETKRKEEEEEHGCKRAEAMAIVGKGADGQDLRGSLFGSRVKGNSVRRFFLGH